MSRYSGSGFQEATCDGIMAQFDRHITALRDKGQAAGMNGGRQ